MDWRPVQCLCLCVFVSCLHAFNLNWNAAPVYTAEFHDSYFGFSVAFHMDQGQLKLLVGAPRAPSKFTKEENVAEPGAVYQCGLEDSRSCDQLRMHAEGNSPQGSFVHHLKNHSWFGGAIAVQDDLKTTVVCAPRWKNSRYSGHYLMNGICYLNKKPSIPEETRLLMPLVDRNNQSWSVKGNKNESVFYYAFGEAGFSAHFPKESSEVVIGAPGVFDWAGAVIKYRPEYEERDKVIPSPIRTNIHFNSYLGYSLSSGKLFRGSREVSYVSGAPRAAGYKGRVYVFNMPDDTEKGLDVKVILDGTQMGEYFGASVCVADLDGDGMDDVVVGAPQFSLSSHNTAELTGDEGRIYVFKNEDGHMVEKTTNVRIMGNKVYGARFGTTVANLGDLNYDKNEDIAVGAPYEDNGVVYIFHGRKTGTLLEQVQVIHAKHIDTRIRGLGISFSQAVDIDKNMYKDTAVGAFESGHAVILRAHPIITLTADLIPSVKRLSKALNFTVKACLSYKGWYPPKSVEAVIGLKVDHNHGRAHIVEGNSVVSSKNYTEIIRRNGKPCKTFDIEVQKENKDPSKPLDIMMTYDLLNNPADQRPVMFSDPSSFCKDCPVLDFGHPHVKTERVFFETGCKTEVCKPNLSVKATFTEVGDTLILGQKQTLEMVVEVVNTGEPAFQPQILITLPSKTPFIRIPPRCENVHDEDQPHNIVLKCDVGNSLEKNTTVRLLLNVKDIPVTEKKLEFEIKATSSGEEEMPEDNEQVLTLQVKALVDMTIMGSSSREQMLYVSTNKTILKDLYLNHTYEVWNLGPSRVDEATVYFHTPHYYDLRGFSNQKDWVELVKTGMPQAYMVRSEQSSDPVQCESLTSGVGFYTGDDNTKYEPGPVLDAKGEREENFTDTRNRTRRQTHEQHQDFYRITPDIQVNKTLFLNCDDKNTRSHCFNFKCVFRHFDGPNTRAIITVPFIISNIDQLGDNLKDKDNILFSTAAKINIEDAALYEQPVGHKPDSAVVQTLLLGKTTVAEGGIPGWIIAVSIICGLLILLLLVTALYKMGFFNRAKKDELAMKKAEAEMESDE